MLSLPQLQVFFASCAKKMQYGLKMTFLKKFYATIFVFCKPGKVLALKKHVKSCTITYTHTKAGEITHGVQVFSAFVNTRETLCVYKCVVWRARARV